MFKRIKPGRAENDQGVSITSTGRYSIEYQNGSHLLKLPFECGWDENNHNAYHIYLPLPLKWETPHQDEIITEEQIEQIKKDFSEAAATDYNSRAVFKEVEAKVAPSETRHN